MLNKYPKTKITLISLLSLIILLVAAVFWIRSIIPSSTFHKDFTNSTPQDLVYLSQGVKEHRGNIYLPWLQVPMSWAIAAKIQDMN